MKCPSCNKGVLFEGGIKTQHSEFEIYECLKCKKLIYFNMKTNKYEEVKN